jgi:hypothetical protein
VLFDFLVEDWHIGSPRCATHPPGARRELQNRRDDLLAFASVLDAILADIAQPHVIPEPVAGEVCLLHRLPNTSSAYWQGPKRLRAKLGCTFLTLFDAVSRAMAYGGQ